jgi:uncharacterized FAD-dependent dehydrogenase
VIALNKNYDLIIVGAGPSGVFTAYELIQLGMNKDKKILLIEQGKSVDKRYCPVEKAGKCVKCKPYCNITSGFSGAGAFSDGKLTLPNKDSDTIEVGGELDKYLGVEETKKLMFYTDDIYLKFGADPKLEGLEYIDEINKIAQRAKENGLTLANCPIRHLGTEKSHELYKKIQDYLLQNNIEILFETNVKDLVVENNVVKGVVISPSTSKDKDNLETLTASKVVLGIGRKGAEWLSKMCNKHNINNRAGVVDIGVRYELPDSVMTDINKYLYEGKFVGYLPPYKDKVRTFCQNPSGFVSAEVYDNGLTLVNGHSYKDKKSTNTNLAILVSHHFRHPFDKPIEYGRNVAKNLNQLGAGNVLVQRLGDIYRGKRTWEEELRNNKVEPTLKAAVPGDITFALGYRTMTNIIEFIKMLDKIIPGFAHPDNLLYSPEIKFYSNQVVIDNNFETSVKNLYSIGDGGGLTRGLMMASCSGVQLARIYNSK